jgi:hypothetical protein
MDRDEICASCGAPIERVDLRGTPFFEHASKKDSIIWRHVDKERNWSHRVKLVQYRGEA